MAILPQQPVPPTVSAEGYAAPGSPAQGQQAPYSRLASLLKKRSQLGGQAEAAQQQAGIYGNIGQQATQRGFTTPAGAGQPSHVDWGSILQAGLGNFMAMRKQKEANQAKSESEGLSAAFAEEVFKNDPEGRRLMELAQAGVPGVEKALAQHLAPQKEKLANFTQAITSGRLDPALAGEMAPLFGFSKEIGVQAAKYSTEQVQRQQDSQFGGQVVLKQLGIEGQKELEDIRAGNKQVLARIDAENDPGIATSTLNKVTDMTKKLDEQVGKLGATDQMWEDVKTAAGSGELFGTKAKVTQFMRDSGIPIISEIGQSMMTPAQKMLTKAVMDETLLGLAAIGGNDSNQEMEFIRASLPDAMDNEEAAKALIKRMEVWRNTMKTALQLRRMDISSGKALEASTEPVDYYRMVTQGMTPEAYSEQLKAQGYAKDGNWRRSGGNTSSDRSMDDQFTNEAAERGF